MTARPAALGFIFALVVVDVIALGVVIPVLPKLVETFKGGDAAAAAEVFGVFGTAWALMQFLSMPVLGALSDRFGRRPVIPVSCFGLGFTPGPALGGIPGGADPRLPFWVAGALTLANAACGRFVLPESLPPDKRSPFSWKRANPVGSLKLLRSHPELLGLAAVLFLMQLSHVVFPAVTVLYIGYRYGWGEMAVGLLLAAVGVASTVVQGGLIRPGPRRSRS